MRIHFRNLHWSDTPRFNPRNTQQLRKLIELPRVIEHWGERHLVTPRLVVKVFGDGRLLLEISPMMFRPHFFVVRISSGWSISNLDRDDRPAPCEWLDDVYGAIEEQFVEWPWARRYGLWYSDDDADENNSRIDFSEGSCWEESRWPYLPRTGCRKAVTQKEA